MMHNNTTLSAVYLSLRRNCWWLCYPSTKGSLPQQPPMPVTDQQQYTNPRNWAWKQLLRTIRIPTTFLLFCDSIGVFFSILCSFLWCYSIIFAILWCLVQFIIKKTPQLTTTRIQTNANANVGQATLRCFQALLGCVQGLGDVVGG